MEKQKSSVPVPVRSLEGDVTTWLLPDGAIARLGRGREPDMAFSPDGQTLAISTSLGLWLYEMKTLSPIALWETEQGSVVRVVFSPNGKWIAACNLDRLRVLDAQNGKYLTEMKPENYIHGMTFSPDNRYLAAAHYHNSSTVEVWHAETGRPFAKFSADSENTGLYRPISFSPDTRLIASTYILANANDAESIVVWDMESGEQIACLSAHTRQITTLCFSPCGQFLASGGEDGTVYVWDVKTWQQVREYTDYGDVYGIIPSWTPDGILRAAIINYDETGPATISVRNLENGEQLYTDQVWGNTIDFSYTGDWGNTFVLSNGSQLVYECRHEFMNVWTSDNPVKRQFTHSPISCPTSMAFSQDGKTLAVAHHHEGVVLWDIESKRSRPAIKDVSAGKNQFVYPPINGKLHVASIKGDTVKLWEADGNGVPLLEGTGREYWSAFPALAPTGTLFAYADADGNIQVWDVQNRKKLYELTHPLEPSDDDDDEDDGDSVSELKFSTDGKLLVSESTVRNVRLWDMELGEEIKAFPSDKTTGIPRFSPCEQYLVCFGKKDFLIWDITHRRLCEDEKIFDDLTTNEIEARLSKPQEYKYLHELVLSSCGQYVACVASSDNYLKVAPICVWEVASGKHLVTFKGHRDPDDVGTPVFSPDSKILASASWDGTVMLWDLTPYL